MKNINNKVIAILTIALFVLGFSGPLTVMAVSPATVSLGAAADYIILSKTAISTTGTTSIDGDIGISPAAATFMTGFSPVMDVSNTFSTSTYVTGKLYASDYTAPTPTNMSTAISNMEAAYTDASGRSADVTELGSGNIGGMTLATGVYKWSTGLTIPTNVTLSGTASDVWIFIVAGNLDIASAKSVILTGGALPGNVFWAVAGTTTLNTTSNFSGTILAGPGTSTIAMLNGAVLNGRALGQKDVTLISNTLASSGGSAPQLTVNKVVINDDDGDKTISDFPLFVDGVSVVSGEINYFTAGTYSVTETTDSEYTQTFSGDCDDDGNITLSLGGNSTCTITNNDIHRSSGGRVIGSMPTGTVVNTTTTTTEVSDVPLVVNTVATTATPLFPKTGFDSQEEGGSWFKGIIFSVINWFE